MFLFLKMKNANFCLDDSAINAEGATSYGWTAAHLVEPEVKAPEKPVSKYQVSNLQELRKLFPQFFKSTNSGYTNGSTNDLP